jgi:alginate O-acetyltransferase complex protein AlgI
LVIASFIFYGWWDWRFLPLIVFSGFIDFFAGLCMVRWHTAKKVFLVLSLLGNIGTLACFKYLDFFIYNINSTLSVMGISSTLPLAGLILPIGISFYTFQSMSYTIDIYRGKLNPTYNVFHFFAYLSMFPQLVAGPIVRASQLLHQLETSSPVSECAQWKGTVLIVQGYFKKVVVADTLARVVNTAFGMETPLQSCGYWWVIIVFFSFQIYCDFSGYSDIARGLAMWMGYKFPVNFNHPYISKSFQEFWMRWHISLSSWFRDYVYIPLGGSQKGVITSHRNMWITMTVSGLWHGAAYNFIIWGAIHALYLSLERITKWPKYLKRIAGGDYLAIVIVYFLTLISWVFFRSETLSQSVQIISLLMNISLFNYSDAKEFLSGDLRALCLCGLMLLWHAKIAIGFRFGINSRMLQLLYIAILVILCIFFRGPGAAFIYFQF